MFVFYDLLTFHAFHCGGIPAISPFDEAVRVILARGSGVPERVEDGVRERPGHEGSDAECVRSHRQRSRDIHLWFAKLFAHSKDKTCTKRVQKVLSMLRMQLNYPINKTNFGKLTPLANAPTSAGLPTSDLIGCQLWSTSRSWIIIRDWE